MEDFHSYFQYLLYIYSWNFGLRSIKFLEFTRSLQILMLKSINESWISFHLQYSFTYYSLGGFTPTKMCSLKVFLYLPQESQCQRRFQQRRDYSPLSRVSHSSYSLYLQLFTTPHNGSSLRLICSLSSDLKRNGDSLKRKCKSKKDFQGSQSW